MTGDARYRLLDTIARVRGRPAGRLRRGSRDPGRPPRLPAGAGRGRRGPGVRPGRAVLARAGSPCTGGSRIELPNFRAALAECLSRADAEQGLRLCLALRSPWVAAGRPGRGHRLVRPVPGADRPGTRRRSAARPWSTGPSWPMSRRTTRPRPAFAGGRRWSCCSGPEQPGESGRAARPGPDRAAGGPRSTRRWPASTPRSRRPARPATVGGRAGPVRPGRHRGPAGPAGRVRARPSTPPWTRCGTTTAGAWPRPCTGTARWPAAPATTTARCGHFRTALGLYRELDARPGDGPLPGRHRPGRAGPARPASSPRPAWPRACSSAWPPASGCRISAASRRSPTWPCCGGDLAGAARLAGAAAARCAAPGGPGRPAAAGAAGVGPPAARRPGGRRPRAAEGARLTAREARPRWPCSHRRARPGRPARRGAPASDRAGGPCRGRGAPRAARAAAPRRPAAADRPGAADRRG